jgi:hypothetical protein
MKKLSVIARTFLAQEETSCHRKKLPGTERNFLAQKETSCHRKKRLATGRYFLTEESNYGLLFQNSKIYFENLTVTGRNFLS